MNIHPVHTADVQGFNVGYGLLQRDHIFLLADLLIPIHCECRKNHFSHSVACFARFRFLNLPLVLFDFGCYLKLNIVPCRGSLMESLWGVSPLKWPFQALFSAVDRQKNQQPHFCKLLIIRAENGNRTCGSYSLYINTLRRNFIALGHACGVPFLRPVAFQ